MVAWYLRLKSKMDSEKINLIVSRLDEIKLIKKTLAAEKSVLKQQLMGLFGIKELNGQKTLKYENLAIKFTGRSKKKLKIPALLRDYGRFDSLLRKCFPLQPRLDVKQYKEMMIINPMVVSKYVTESKVSYSVDVKKNRTKGERQ